jgi:hypothetical protein
LQGDSTIPNPQAGAARQPPTISDPGHAISLRSENNLKVRQTYLTDRAKVWDMLSELTRQHDCWSYICPAQRSHDGRMAFLGLKGHYLGVNNVDNMSTMAENRMKTTLYHGEKRRWNFECYVKVHIDQHAILQGLVAHGYSGIDERSKVRHLVNGIKTPAIDPVKTRIMSDAALRNDFEACVNLFQDSIHQSGAALKNDDVHVAAVSHKPQGGGRGGKSQQQQQTG